MIDFDALVIGPTLAVFGESVTYLPFVPILVGGNPVLDQNGNETGSLGASYAATGVFDMQFYELRISGGSSYIANEAMDYGLVGGISEGTPILGVQLSKMETVPRQQDQIVIRGQTYVVKEVRPDSHGHAKLLMNLAP